MRVYYRLASDNFQLAYLRLPLESPSNSIIYHWWSLVSSLFFIGCCYTMQFTRSLLMGFQLSDIIAFYSPSHSLSLYQLLACCKWLVLSGDWFSIIFFPFNIICFIIVKFTYSWNLDGDFYYFSKLLFIFHPLAMLFTKRWKFRCKI